MLDILFVAGNWWSRPGQIDAGIGLESEQINLYQIVVLCSCQSFYMLAMNAMPTGMQSMILFSFNAVPRLCCCVGVAAAEVSEELEVCVAEEGVVVAGTAIDPRCPAHRVKVSAELEPDVVASAPGVTAESVSSAAGNVVVGEGSSIAVVGAELPRPHSKGNDPEPDYRSLPSELYGCSITIHRWY
ncbi:hypothetical protein AC579_2180 [Pseudocercospora musae]|uniref:Uncharacterized protein n=1 Tax=Pseudocercospora musae TaxID=113226 RepID=A0A139GU65_9PEZI|nr:hypothetical protein AC579_2180 [Pseudocercospora musae]